MTALAIEASAARPQRINTPSSCPRSDGYQLCPLQKAEAAQGPITLAMGGSSGPSIHERRAPGYLVRESATLSSGVIWPSGRSTSRYKPPPCSSSKGDPAIEPVKEDNGTGTCMKRPA